MQTLIKFILKTTFEIHNLNLLIMITKIELNNKEFNIKFINSLIEYADN